MECPKCRQYSVSIKNGILQCGVPGCTYTKFHPISYENDVRQFQDSKGPENRYTSLYNNAAQNIGISINKQAIFDKQYKAGMKYIHDYCHLFKICGRIQSVASARFASILRIKIGTDKENTNNGSSTNGNNQNEKSQKLENPSLKMEDKLKIQQNQQGPNNDSPQKEKKAEKFPSTQKLAAYCLYSACFQNELFFEDINIYHKWLKISKQQWRNLTKDLSSILSQKIDYIPVQKAWHYTLRVCRKRKINIEQQKAMKRMCQNIQNNISTGTRRTTIAACVFWQICIHSKRYKQLQLSEICKSVKVNKQEEMNQKQMQKYFDCTPDTVKFFFNNNVKNDLYSKYLPKWTGRDESTIAK